MNEIIEQDDIKKQNAWVFNPKRFCVFFALLFMVL